MGGWWRWALVGPDGVALSRIICVSASVNLPLHYKVQKFSSGAGSPGWSRKKGRKTVVYVPTGKLGPSNAAQAMYELLQFTKLFFYVLLYIAVLRGSFLL